MGLSIFTVHQGSFNSLCTHNETPTTVENISVDAGAHFTQKNIIKTTTGTQVSRQIKLYLIKLRINLMSLDVWNGWVVCYLYFSQTWVWIWFNAWFFLVRDILMGTDLFSILKVEGIVNHHVGCNTKTLETAVSGSGYGYTYVSVDIFVCLWGCTFPLGCQATGNMF